MADEGITLGSINFHRAFPFTHIFRSFRIATHLSKLFLALFLLILLYGGGRFLDTVWPTQDLAVGGDLGYVQPGNDYGQPQGIFNTFFSHEILQVDYVSNAVVSQQWTAMGLSIEQFFIYGPHWFYSEHPVYAGIYTIWFLLIWSIFGGAIARIAAVHVARDEKIAVRQALQFSIGKILSFIFAPLIPMGIFIFLGIALSIEGIVLLHIPYAGPIILGASFFLALGAGFVMTLVLLGLIGGFNLMYPTIAVEGSDSFDAISRSFSYVYARPWRLIWYFLVAVVYGGVTYMFVRWVIWIILALTHFFVGWWLSGQPQLYWNGMHSIWPIPVFSQLPYQVDLNHLKWSEQIAAGFIVCWVYLTIALLGAFAISFYFSSSTIVYFLMRAKVDATDMDDVYLADADDEFADIPITTEEPPPAAPAV